MTGKAQEEQIICPLDDRRTKRPCTFYQGAINAAAIVDGFKADPSRPNLLLCLPRELRDTIYSLVLSEDIATKAFPCQCPAIYHKSATRVYSDDTLEHLHRLVKVCGILSVSQQISAEALETLYSSQLRIDCNEVSNYHWDDNRPMCIDMMQHITRVHFSTNHLTRQHSKIMKLLVDTWTVQHCLKEVTLHIDCTIPRWNRDSPIPLQDGVTRSGLKAYNRLRDALQRPLHPCSKHGSLWLVAVLMTVPNTDVEVNVTCGLSESFVTSTSKLIVVDQFATTRELSRSYRRELALLQRGYGILRGPVCDRT